MSPVPSQASSGSAVREIVLVKGGVVAGDAEGSPAYTYWDAEDTTLDSSNPDSNRGGEATLLGGPGHVILLRFGDLVRAAGSTRHVRDASLRLRIVSGDVPKLQSMARVLVPWGEGPVLTMSETIARITKQGSAPSNPSKSKQEKPTAAKLSATWRDRLTGAENGAWESPGAGGSDDSTPLETPTLEVSGNDLVIGGLANAVQAMEDHPDLNFGIALRFSNDVEFASDKAPEARPRLELQLDRTEKTTERTGPDLSVVRIEQQGDGPERTFIAHVKNVGSAASQGFGAVWSINGRPGSSFDNPGAIEPGAEMEFTYRTTAKADPMDSRSLWIGFHVTPKGPDADPANDGLAIPVTQLRLCFVLHSARQPTDLARPAVEDWLQSQVRIFNDTYLAQSRYSFAPDGATQRVAIAEFRYGKAADVLPTAAPEGEILVDVSDSDLTTRGASIALLRRIASALGLIDLSVMNESPRSGSVTVPGAENLGTQDLYAGLMGGGDTRFDGPLPGAIPMPPAVSFAPPNGSLPLESSGLLAMTDVFTLNHLRANGPAGATSPVQDQPAGGVGATAWKMPKVVLLRARDIIGRPLSGVTVDFFQSSGGKIENRPAAFSVKTNEAGVTPLPNRDGFGPFGMLDPHATNGLLLARLKLNGVTDFAWLKAWQFADSYARGNVAAAVLDIPFNVPGAPLEIGTNRAAERIVTDSLGQPADKLAAAVDGNPSSMVTLGAKPGDWIEVDLGRDRTIGEIRIAAPADRFWKSFDIVLYGTGQTPQDGITYATEGNWAYSRLNRAEGPVDSAFVPYRGMPLQIRYIRIVSRSGGEAQIGEIQATPVSVSN